MPSAATLAAGEPPADLIELGALRGAYGLKGWSHFVPFAAVSEVLPIARRWWLKHEGTVTELIPESARRHGDAMLVKWTGCDSKEEADALKGATLSVSRSEFPPLRDGEYYWVDLVGCRVVNRERELGVVTGLREGPGGQWLEVRDGTMTLLIPLAEPYIDAIDLAARQVQVDWQEDW